MTKWILYIVLVKPGMLVTMHTSFWSLTSCNEARTEAMESHEDITFAVCVPEERSTDTFYETEDDRDGDPDIR